MSRVVRRGLGVALGVGLLVLHLDFWRAPSDRLFFGWMPEELLYRLGWMLFAWVFLVVFVDREWSDADRATGDEARERGA